MNASTLSRQVSISCLAATISAVTASSLMCVAVERSREPKDIIREIENVTWQMA